MGASDEPDGETAKGTPGDRGHRRDGKWMERSYRRTDSPTDRLQQPHGATAAGYRRSTRGRPGGPATCSADSGASGTGARRPAAEERPRGDHAADGDRPGGR